MGWTEWITYQDKHVTLRNRALCGFFGVLQENVFPNSVSVDLCATLYLFGVVT